MKITKQLVASLKEASGAGLNACYKALKAVNGNIEAASEELRKTGMKFSAAKANRVTNEGAIAIAVSENAQKAVMIKLTCETDFVANNEVFQNFLNELTTEAIKNNATTVDALLDVQVQNKDKQATVSLRTLLAETIIPKVGENIQISQFQWIETPHHIGHYVHKGKYGALVELKGGNQDTAKEIAIHIAASHPEDLEALLQQDFYKDPSHTIAQYLSKQNAQLIQYTLFTLKN